MALAVFFSSTGFVLNTHYCQDELKNVALFVKAKPCHPQKNMKHCPLHGSDDTNKQNEAEGCCDDRSDYVKSESDQISPVHKTQVEINPVQLNVILIALQIELPPIDSRTRHYLNYKPPLIVCDIPVQLQTFRC